MQKAIGILSAAPELVIAADAQQVTLPLVAPLAVIVRRVAGEKILLFEVARLC